MPQNTLGLPSGEHGRCFRAVDDHLRADPVLKRVIKTWRSYRGDKIDASPPTIDQAPWIRLTLGAGGATMASERQKNFPLTIHIDTFVKGLIAEDPTDLWDAIRSALFPGDKSLITAVSIAGGMTYRITQPSFTTIVDAQSQPIGFEGRGSVVVDVLQSTPY
jgi:hypothetical protein